MYALQDLAGEVARLRAECSYFMARLDELEALSNHRPWMGEDQDNEIVQANARYARSAKQNLEHATYDLSNWARVIGDIQTRSRTHLAI